MVEETFILEGKGLRKEFGSLVAVAGVDIRVRPGELHAIIGPNGAGKTTLFNLLSGNLRPTGGTVWFKGRDITAEPLHRRVHLGIGRSFQITNIFPSLTVLDNVRIAYHPHAGYSMSDAILHNAHFNQKEKELTERAQEFLGVFNLQDRQGEIAKNLPYGEQRRLEIARALAAYPKLLLLDEPAAGMNPAESMALMDLIHFIRERFNLTILLIEHQMRVVMGICEWITVVDFGEVIARGTPQEIQSNPRVIEAYLGPGAAALSQKYRRKKPHAD